MTRTRTDARIAAQVAVESVANVGLDEFDADTIAAVIRFGEEQGVSDLYLDLIRSTVPTCDHTPETPEQQRQRILRDCGEGCTGGPDCPNLD